MTARCGHCAFLRSPNVQNTADAISTSQAKYCGSIVAELKNALIATPAGISAAGDRSRRDERDTRAITVIREPAKAHNEDVREPHRRDPRARCGRAAHAKNSDREHRTEDGPLRNTEREGRGERISQHRPHRRAGQSEARTGKKGRHHLRHAYVPEDVEPWWEQPPRAPSGPLPIDSN